MLIPQEPIDYAKGKLDTGAILKHYIQYASRQLNHPTQRGLDNVLSAAAWVWLDTTKRGSGSNVRTHSKVKSTVQHLPDYTVQLTPT